MLERCQHFPHRFGKIGALEKLIIGYNQIFGVSINDAATNGLKIATLR